IHSPGKCFKLIAKPAQPSKSLFNIKKSRLLYSGIPSIISGGMESQSRTQNQRVFSNPPGAFVGFFGSVLLRKDMIASIGKAVKWIAGQEVHII
ncbi:hypothetical protein, partial [Gluconobacter cerinus]|uniref:hypothetical protein n=1 Tax=Gluconobacter cerinus TaxID=38307 RepID=UPI001B8BCA8A